ncbi:hypothetical protein Lac3_26090 [Claveliimonas bilis]|nr:hypothetical protein Lac3_26090 [Claveliimonas bilis]
MAYIAYAVAWISVSAAVIAGIYMTGSAWCLLAFLFVAFIKVKRRSDDDEHEKETD